MKKWKKGLKRLTAIALAVMMVGTTVDFSAFAVPAAEGVSIECTCETDDPAFHATNCPAYIAPENPECTCAEKCTDDTLNVWCDVCGVQGVSACQGEDTAVAYEIVANGTCGAEGNGSDVTWTLDSDGTLTISGTGAMADYELVLEYPYHYTTPWHNTDNDGKYQNSNIKKVVVEEGITHIGNSAFKDFTELTSISIPNTVKSIGKGSISYCKKLTSLVIPDSVTSIGNEVFYENTMLTSVTIGNSVESIGDSAFTGVGRDAGTNFTITLPKSVTYIDPSAFSYMYRGATIRYSCSYNEGNGYSTGTTYATLEQYHLYEYSSSGNKINCSGCTCGEYSGSTATLSLSSDESIYYTGEEIKPAVTVTYPDGWGGDEIEPNESNCTYSGNINVGTATCTFKYAEGVEASIDFTIEKADSSVATAPTPIEDLVYEGVEQNLIAAGTATGGEVRYSLEQNGTYSTTIPKGTKAGDYTVWYKVVGDENHNDTEPIRIDVKISPKAITVASATAATTDKTYDGTNTVEITDVTLNDVEDSDTVDIDSVQGKLVNEDGTVANGYAGTYSYVNLSEIALKGEDAANYTIAATAEKVKLSGNVTINKATAQGLINGSKDYIYSEAKTGEKVTITGIPEDCGTVNYRISSIEGNKDILNNISVSDGVLTYDVEALVTEDSSATITVMIEMQNYNDLTYTYTITRSNCDHTEGKVVCDATVVATDKAPTCTEAGIGHTTCTKAGCGEVVETGITIPALGHDCESEVTTKATYTTEGIRTYTCKRNECDYSYTESIPKLTKPSGSGSSGSSSSTTNPPSTEVPSTEEPSTETPSTETPSTEDSSTEDSSTEEPGTSEEDTVEWKTDEKGTFYEKEDGTKATGWYEMEEDVWYYFDENGYRQTGWEKDGENWYYLNENGVMQTGWQKDGESWYYLSENGAMKTGWQKDGESWYYLSESGAMKTGWQKDGESWYYLSESGAMKTGWQKDGESWYYLNESGAMKTGWQKDGESWYYLSESGAMKTGWQKDGETWYYLSESGAMKTGWLQVGADWFYLNSNGSMAANTYIGKWYVDKNGYYIPSKTK